MLMDFSKLDVDALSRLDVTEFQDFCYSLLRHEVRERHDSPDLDGPAEEYHGDGARDMLLIISKPPRRARRADDLTWDEGQIFYSCKTGSTWQKHVRKEVGASRSTLEKRVAEEQGTPATASELITLVSKPQDQPKSQIIELLRKPSNRYVVLTNQRAARKTAFRNELAARLAFWLDALGHGEPTDDLQTRIHVFDANDLVAFVHYYRPILGGSWIEKLGTREPDGLLAWEKWTDSFEAQRRMLRFREDEARRMVAQRIQQVLTDTAVRRPLWIAGPPGVGKTRVVHRALEMLLPHGERRRVRYIDEWQRAGELIRQGLCRQHSDIILVVDEAGAMGADNVALDFSIHSKGTNSTLLLIGPMPLGPVSHLDNIRLEPLSSAETQALVSSELPEGTDSNLTERIITLAEGYPLFAYLLARAVAANPQALDVPDVQSDWRAAQLVLAGPITEYGSDFQRHAQEADLRGRALLLVIMAPNLDFGLVEPPVQEQLCRALRIAPASWYELERAARDCEKRGLLRSMQGGTRRYVSPHNLARMLIHYFLSPNPGPDLEPSLRKYAPEQVAELYARAEALGIKESFLKSMAAGALGTIEERLATAPGSEAALPPASEQEYDPDFWPPRLSTNAWTFAARWQTERAAHVFGLLPSTYPALARGERTRIFLSEVYGVLARQPLSNAAFAHLEAGLNSLAELWQDTGVMGVEYNWHALFSPWPHPTRRPFAERLACLRRRTLAAPGYPTVSAKRLQEALRSIPEAALAGPGTPYATANHDEEHEGSQQESLAEALRASWSLVIELARDAEAEIAHVARTASHHWLRERIFRCLHAADLAPLTAIVASWTAEERRALDEKLAAMSIDETHSSLSPELTAAVAALRKALLPQSYHERLLARVHTLEPDADVAFQSSEQRAAICRERDAAVIAEGLAPPVLLRDELATLASDDAIRGRELAVELGRQDVHLLFLPPLTERARADQRVLPERRGSLLPYYLLGWSRRAGAHAVDAWLEEHMHLGDARLYPALARTMLLLGSSSMRLTWLERLLDTGELDPWELAGIGTPEFGGAVDTETLCAFIRKLLSGNERSLTAALMIAREPVRRHGADLPEVAAKVLEVLLPQVTLHAMEAATFIVAWQRTAVALIDSGRTDAVLDALTAYLRAHGSYGVLTTVHVVWQRLAQRLGANALWERFAPLLEESRDARFKLDRLGFVHLIAPAAVLAWVGEDIERGIWIAELCHPKAKARGPKQPLDEIERGLIIHFGAHSTPARILAKDMLQGEVTPSVLACVRTWQEDPEPAVAAWAEALAGPISRQLTENEVYRERFAG